MLVDPSSQPETPGQLLSTTEILAVKQQASNLLKSAHAVQHGHFKLSSGLHSDTYVQVARIMENPMQCAATFGLLHDLIVKILPAKVEPTVVIGAAHGGIIASYALAATFNCKAIFAERINGKLELRRGFTFKPNDRIIIVEDVVTTGKTVWELFDIISRINMPLEIMCVATLVERNKCNFGPIPQIGLMSPKDAVIQEPSECAQCLQGIELVAPGSRFSQSLDP